ncbi:hypothetical protein [Phytomonospora endophytica]|uniref:Branched-subunit amino acid transport protein n=1 Tax=Phytomonospora endophytica TaxID=714109 RepID=A0A841FYE8_9ACTN|nr:hypothetical protein [Phytomonospora endophytica]MBB6038748.1 branched-subunit amino acid transport protein [Phytomonospora endophytica]GIG68456.1 hypothetical protein Pen01_47510 [Phytomonospora endophytica]
MQWSTVIAYGTGYGLALSVLFTAGVFAGAALSRDFLLDDYPEAIQRRYGRPKSARGKRVALVFGIFVWGVCGVPLMTAAMVGLDGALDDGLGFLPAAVCAALVFATLVVFDTVVLDWIILAGLRPQLLVLPGTEDMAEYGDLRFHLVAALKGSPLIVVVGLVTGGLAALFA